MKFTYANIASTLALVMALSGGTAYAASQLVTSPTQLKNGVVTNAKLRGGITVEKLTPAARQSLRGQRGPAGVNGPQGEQGPKGDTGYSQVRVHDELFDVPAHGWTRHSAMCASDEIATGGGIKHVNGLLSDYKEWGSYPVDADNQSTDNMEPRGWRVAVSNSGAGVVRATVWVVCARKA